MVSALWKASSEGNLQSVLELLKDASVMDIEIKDHTGVTPLIEAVKNGHLEVVRALLDKGANPISIASQGRPENYTSDPAILDILRFAQSRLPPPESAGYQHDVNGDPSKSYYPPPPGPYAYFHPPPMPDSSGAYYPPMQAGDQVGPGNLPPPEVARFIPCRYFPACRYGSSCLFAHPQGPYYQGPIPPPAQYSYDQMAPQPYPPNYYAVPPPSFPPNGIPSHVSPPAGPHPHPHMAHVRSGSEIISPVQAHFSPPSVPYNTISPTSPNYSAQVPVPMSIPPSLPLQHQPPPPPGPQSPQAMYPSGPTSAPPFAAPQNGVAHYPSIPPPAVYPETNNGPKSPPPQQEGYNHSYREGPNHHRRGSIRRGSFGGGRKPPCLFFPSGRCRNGDDCRFPHVIPDGTASHPPFSGRNGPRRGPPNGNGNGFASIEEKFSSLAIQDEALSRQNGTENSSRSQSTEGGNRSRYPQATSKLPMNGIRDRRLPMKQRVPNADEFPVLAGSITPPLRSPGTNGSLTNGHGPTAAQVLQAPPPFRRDGTKESTPRGGSPDSTQPNPPVKAAVEYKGAGPDVNFEHASKLPVSFASIATVPSVGKEVSVTA